MSTLLESRNLQWRVIDPEQTKNCTQISYSADFSFPEILLAPGPEENGVLVDLMEVKPPAMKINWEPGCPRVKGLKLATASFPGLATILVSSEISLLLEK